MTAWSELKKLKAACREQWIEACARLDAMGITVMPWPGVGLAKIDVSELEVDVERPLLLRRQLRRFHPAGNLACGDHVESFPLYKAHELAPGNYEDRKLLNPEETVREWVKRVTNQIVTDCDAAKTSRFFLRVEPTVGCPKGDDFGNWMLVLLLGAPSPVADLLSSAQVETAMESLREDPA